MALTVPLGIFDETTFENKLLYKGLAYLLQADNAGERHEVSGLYELHRGMEINGMTFKATAPGDFSRGAALAASFTQAVGGKAASWFGERAGKFMKPLAQDSKLQNGVNEIDSFAAASDGTRAFVEFKSGGAASSGTQTSSYMQISTELAAPAAAGEVWFVHCYDAAATQSASYVWQCLDSIQANPRGGLSVGGRAFLTAAGAANLLGGGGNANTKMDAMIAWHNTTYGTSLGSGTESARLGSMNAILSRHFKVQIFTTYINKSVDRELIRGYMRKLLPETTGWYDTSKQQSFWMQVYNDALG